MKYLPENNNLSIQEAAEFLGVSTKTLRRWEAKEILKASRTSGGHRRYNLNKLNAFKRLKGKKRLRSTSWQVIYGTSQANEFQPVTSKTTFEQSEKDEGFVSFEEKSEKEFLKEFPTLYKLLPITPKLILNFGLGISILILALTLITKSEFRRFLPFILKATQNQISSHLPTYYLPHFLQKEKGETAGKDLIKPQVLAISTDLDAQKFNLYVDTNLKKTLMVEGNATLGGDLLSLNDTFNLINETVTTLNIGGAATTVSIASDTGNTTINNNLIVSGTANDLAGTVNFSGNNLTSSGDLVIDPTGGGVSIGTGTAGSVDLAGDDFYITGDLEVDGSAYLPTLIIGSDTITDISGSGLTVSSGSLQTSLGTSIESSEIANDTIKEEDLYVSNTATNNYVLAYNSSTGGFTWVTQSGIFTDAGTYAYLTTTTDSMTLGGTTELAKLAIVGDADENQFLVRGNSTQSTNLAVFENSSGTDILSLSNTGTLILADGGLLDLSTITHNDVAPQGLRLPQAATFSDISGGEGYLAWDTDNDALTYFDGSSWNTVTGGGITGSGTSGYITYWNSGSAVTGEANLYWDATNDLLGVGLSSPTSQLHVSGTYSTNPLVVFNETGGQTIIEAQSSSSPVARLTNSGNLYITGTLNTLSGYLTIDSAGGTTTIDDIVNLGSSSSGVNITTAGLISDINANLVLNDTVDIGSATGGINITTAGVISDIDGDISLADNVGVTGNLDVNGSLFAGTSDAFQVSSTGVITAATNATINDIDISAIGAISDVESFALTTSGNTWANSTGNLTISGDLAVNGGDITTSGTGLNIDVGNNGTIFFRDGTNTLVSVKDQGSFGYFFINPDTGSLPGTCTEGDIYANDNGNLYYCEASNAWIDITQTGGNVSGSGAGGQVTFWDGTSSISGDGTFFWDNTNNLLSVGTGTPAHKLHVSGGYGGNALAVLNETLGNDILAASASGGTTRFRLTNAGNVLLTGTLGTITGDLTIDSAGSNTDVVDNLNAQAGLDVTGGSLTVGTSYSWTTGGVITAATTDTINDVDISATGAISNVESFALGTAGNSWTSGGNLTISGDLAVNGGDITTSGTGLNIDVGNTGTIFFRDGTNTLVSIKDQGGFGYLSVNPDTGSLPGSCTEGDIYANDNGNLYYCEASNAWIDITATGGNVSGSGAEGQVTFWDGTSSISGDGTFYWDNTNNLLGVGTGTPLHKLHVSGGYGGNALAVLNETLGNDIIAASASGGTTRFRLTNAGNVLLTGTLGTITGDLTIDSAGSNTDVVDNLNAQAGLDVTGASLIVGPSTNFEVTTGGNITTTGTTGMTFSGNEADILFSSTGTHLISASSGTLQLGAYTLGGAVAGNAQNITGLGNLDVNGQVDLGDGGDTVAISGTTVSITSNLATNDITLTSADQIIFDDSVQTVTIPFSSSDDGLQTPTKAIVDAINEAWNAATGGSGGIWSLSNNTIYPTTLGNRVGIGTITDSDITSKLYITSSPSQLTGKALAIFRQTEDQDILTASSSSVTRLTLTSTGDLRTGDLTLGLNDASATITTADTENLTIDPASTADLYFHGSTYQLSDEGDLTLGGRITFENAEFIQNEIDGSIAFTGSGGTNNGSIAFDLETNAIPTLTSSTDTVIGIDEDLQFIGAQQITTSTSDLTIAPAGNLVINTTGGTIDVNGPIIDIETQATDIEIIGNNATALTISDGSSNYITVDTTTSSEALRLGTAQTLDINIPSLDLSSQATSIDLINTNADALSIESGLLRLDTVASALEVNGTTTLGDGGTTNYAQFNTSGDLSFFGSADSITGPGSLFSFSNTNAGITLSTITSGDLSLTSAGEINFNDVTTGSIPFASDDTTLNTPTVAIVDAINEAWNAALGGGGGLWSLTAGAIHPGSPYTNVVDFLIGGSATTSAKFAFINVNDGVPTASVSAGTAGAMYMTANGTLATTAQQTLTLGGTDSGNIIIDPDGGNGNLTLTGDLIFNSETFSDLTGNGLTTSANVLTIDLTSVADGLSSNTNSSSGLEVLPSGLTLLQGCGDDQILKWDEDADYWRCVGDEGAGAGSSKWVEQNNLLYPINGGSLSVAVGTVTEADMHGLFTVSGTRTGRALAIFNDTGTDQNIITASASSVTVFTLDRSGNLYSDGVFSFGDTSPDGNAYNTIGTGDKDRAEITGSDDLYITGDLEVDGTIYQGDNPVCDQSGTNCPAGAVTYWDQNAGAIVPKNTTMDLLVGGTSTASAKFAFINVNDGTPTASVSAGIAGATFITADGTIATTALQALTLGGATTGSIRLMPNADTGDYFVFSSDATNLSVTTTDAANLTLDPDSTADIYFHGSTYNISDTGDLTIGGRITFENAGYIQNEVDGILYFNEPTLQLVAATALDIDSPSINLSTQATDIELANATSNALTISETNNNYLSITTNDTESVTLDLPVAGATSTIGNLFTGNIAKTINLGTGTASDTINIGTDTTSADVITVGNSNTGTTLALTGGDDWSITTAGVITAATNETINGVDISLAGAISDVTQLTVDNLDINGNLISSVTGDIDITPVSASNLDIDVAGGGELQIDGGLTDFGSGTYTYANGDNDVGIAGDLEVLGNIYDSSGRVIAGYWNRNTGVLFPTTTSDVIAATSGATTVATFTSSGTNNALRVGDITNYSVFTSTGDLTFTGTADTITGPGANGLTLTNTDGQLQLTTISTGEIDISSAGILDLNSQAGTWDATSLSFDGTLSSNLTVTGAGENLTLAVAGGSTQSLILSSAGTGTNAIDINATAGGIDIDSNGAFDVLAGGAFSIDGTGASNITAASGNLTLSTASSGTLILNSAGALDIDAGAGITIDSGGSGDISLTSVGEINFNDVTTGTIPFAADDTTLNTPTVAIVDAINEAYAAAGGVPGGAWTLSNNTIYPTTLGNRVGIGTTTYTDIVSKLYITSGATQLTGKALAILNQTEDQDILAASSSAGTTRFRLTNSGNVLLTGTLGTISGDLTINSAGDTNVSDNLNAQNGLDVTGASLTVGPSSEFSVATTGVVTLPNTNTLTGVANYLRLSQGLAVGGATTYYIDSSGHANLNNITGAGTLDINGGGIHDIAGTLNLSGNTLTSSGDLTINSGAGDVYLTDADVLVIGGHAGGQLYNIIANPSQTSNSGAMGADNDLYIGGDLEVDGTIYSNSVSGSYTQGSVIFAGAAGVLTEDNPNFFWDDTNNLLGIQEASPEHVLEINGGYGGNALVALVETLGNDILVASAGATTRARLTNAGNLYITGSLDTISGDLTIDSAGGTTTLNDTVNLGSLTTGVQVSTAGQIQDINANLVLLPASTYAVQLGSASTGISIAESGTIQDIDGNLILLPFTGSSVFLGSASNGLAINEDGQILDYDDAGVYINDDATVSGELRVTGADIHGPSGEDIDLGEAVADTTTFYITQTGELTLDANYLRPFANNGLSLGSASYQFADLYLGGGNINLGAVTDIDIVDTLSDAFTISQSNNNYLTIDTVDSSELLTLGNALADMDIRVDVGTSGNFLFFRNGSAVDCSGYSNGGVLTTDASGNIVCGADDGGVGGGGVGPVGSPADGQVTYWRSANTITGEDDFYYNYSNNLMGLGTGTSPAHKLHVSGGYAGNALVALDETLGNDILTASSGGTTRFTMGNLGNITMSTGTTTPLDLTRTSDGQWVAFDDGTDVWGLYNYPGSPEGNITANTGTLAMDTSNGTLYVKTDDADPTGWINLATGTSTTWTHIDHALYPDHYWADDLLIGGNATGSSAFQVYAAGTNAGDIVFTGGDITGANSAAIDLGESSTNGTGMIDFYANGDTSDYLYMNTASNLPSLIWETGMTTNDAGIRLSATDDTGQLQFRDQNSATWVSFDNFGLASNDFWQLNAGSLSPFSLTADVNLGATATASANISLRGSLDRGLAAMMVNQTESQDIFTASGGGTPRFTVGYGGNLTATSSATTGTAFEFGADDITTGTGINLTLDQMSTGYGLNITSTSSVLSTGRLLNLDWSPLLSSTATGDLFRLNIGANGDVTNLLNITNNGSTVFRVSENLIESAVPHAFTAAGDVTMAYDLNFTNPTAAYIEFQGGPGYIRTYHPSANLDLTLSSANSGDIVLNPGGELLVSDADPSIIFDATTSADTDFWLGVVEDAGGDDDDYFRIGDGTTLGSNTFLTLDTSGRLGVGDTIPDSRLHITNNPSTLTGQAALIVDQYEAQDVLTASASGSTVMRVDSSGNVLSYGAIGVNYDASPNNLLSTTSGSQAVGSMYWGNDLVCDPTLTDCGWLTSATNYDYWQLNAGSLSPFSITADLNLGATATASANISLRGSLDRGKAAAIINQTESQDILTASDGGTTRLTLTEAGQLVVPTTGSTGGLVLGDDTNLYDGGTNILRTSDNLTVDLDLIVSGGDITGANSAQIDLGESSTNGTGMIDLYANGDTSDYLYLNTASDLPSLMWETGITNDAGIRLSATDTTGQLQYRDQDSATWVSFDNFGLTSSDYWQLNAGSLSPFSVTADVNLGATATASAKISMRGSLDRGLAAMMVNQTESQDIFTASGGGTPRFTIGYGGNLTATSSATTGTAFEFGADDITSGTGMNLTLDQMTIGYGLNITSTSSVLSTGRLLNLDWSPLLSSTATGDLFRLNIGANGDVTNLLNITNNGSTVFRVAENQIESAVPHAFTAAGDVSFSYDAIFTNQTASQIKTYGPFTINVGESFESNDLTLNTYGSGDIVLTPGDLASGNTILYDSDPSIVYDATTSGDTDFWSGVVEDDDGSDNDYFRIGDGTTPGSNVFLTLDTNGLVGIGDTTPDSRLHITNNPSTLTGKAALTIDQYESEDIFTASDGGTTRLTLTEAGQLVVPTTGSTGGLVLGDDTQLYDAGTNLLRTPDNLTVDLDLIVTGGDITGLNSAAIDLGESATNGTGMIDLMANGDADDYLYVNTASNLPSLIWETGMSTNDAGIRLSATDDTGQLQYRDQNSGTWVAFDDFGLASNDYWQLNYGSLSPFSLTADVNLGATATASANISMRGSLDRGLAAMMVNQTESQDILTASAGGTTRFTLGRNGDLALSFDSANLTSGNGLSLDWDGATTLAGAGSGLNITTSDIVGNGQNFYGINISDLGTFGAGNEYGIYVQGTDWDYSAYFQDTVYSAAGITLADGAFLDLSAVIHDDTALQGLRLPQNTDLTNPTSGEGFLAWESDINKLKYYDSTMWVPVASESAAFERAKYDRIVDCNGGGTDITIAAAITNSSAGDSIYIAPCTYSENITISKELKLFGAGAGATIITGTTDATPTVNISTGVNNVEIHDLEITHSDGTTAGEDGINNVNGNDLIVNNVEISSVYQGIDQDDGNRFHFEHLYIHNTNHSGIDVESGDNGQIVNNTLATIGATSGNGDGIRVYIAPYVRISGNYIGSTQDYGIRIDGSSNSNCVNNNLYRPGETGIYIYQSNYLSVSDNAIRESGYINNSNNGYGISTYGSSNVTISGNNIYDSNSHGIKTSNTSNSLNITGNNVYQSTYDGIELSATAQSGVTVTGNVLSNNANYGIDIDNTLANSIVSNNTFISNTTGDINNQSTSDDNNQIGPNAIQNVTATATDVSQLGYHPATGTTFTGDLLQMTMDGVDTDSFTGNGLHMIVDQSQVTGLPLLIEDDVSTDLLRLNDLGQLSIGSSTNVGIMDIDATNIPTIGKAALIVNHDEQQALFTASASGTPRFTLDYTGAINATASSTTTTAFEFGADNVTSGTGINLTLDQMTQGYGLNITSTSSVLSSGRLLNLDWSPLLSSTATGDLFRLNIGANGNVTNLLNITDDGSTLFRVSEAQIESAVPHAFTASGDVTMAYDLKFANQTSANIKTDAPLTIDVGESSESNNLTLKTYNAGDIVLDNATYDTMAIFEGDTGRMGLGTTTPDGFLHIDTSNAATFGKAALIINHDETQDILSASASGTTRLTLNNDGDLLPGSDDSQDLGSNALRWQDLYLGPGSINIGTSGNTALISYDTSNNYLNFDPDGDATGELFMYDSGSLRLIASSYLNFGTTEGSSGYGIRDNSGTIQLKNSGSDWVNVATQSAVFERAKYDRIVDCEGGGTDTTITAAITNASAGDSIYIAPCTYTDNITIDKELKLFGAGAGATIITSSSGDTVTVSANIDDVEIHNMEITSSSTTSGDYVVYLAGGTSNNILLDKLDISGGRIGVYNNAGDNVRLTNSYIHESYEDAVWFGSGSNYNIISNNQIYYWRAAGAGSSYGIFVSGYNNTIIGNVVDGNERGSIGISVSGTAQRSNSITGNTIFDCIDDGIVIGDAYNTLISGNNIYSNTDDGIWFHTSVVSGLRTTVTGNTIAENGGDGVDLGDSDNTFITVTGNTILSNGSAIANNTGNGNRVFANSTDATGALAEEFSILDTAADTLFNFSNPNASYVTDLAIEGGLSLGKSTAPVSLLDVTTQNLPSLSGKAVAIFDQYEAQDSFTASASGTTRFYITSSGVTWTGLSNTASSTAVCSSLGNDSDPVLGTPYELRDCETTPATDYAEAYPTEEGVDYGDIVVTTEQLVATKADDGYGNLLDNEFRYISKLAKSSQPYQGNIIGIVSKNYGDFTSTGLRNVDPIDHPMPVALSGRVPVKMSTASDPVQPGDYLTTSNEAGKAMKAKESGRIIGTALASWTPDSDEETVMVFVNNTYYDYSLALNDIGEINLVADNNSQATSYQLQNTNGSLIDRVGAFAELITGNIQAGYLEIKEIVADEIIANFVKTNTLEAEVIETAKVLTSEIASVDGDIILDLVNEAIFNPEDSDSGINRLIVRGVDNSEVFSVTADGNVTITGELLASKVTADEVNADQVNVQTASIAGELRAGRILADEIVGLDAKFAALQTATIAGITREEIEALIAGAELDQDLLAESQSWSTDAATESADFTTSYELLTTNLFVTGNAVFDSLSVTNSVVIGSDLVISSQESIVNGQLSKVNSLDTLSAPLSLQSSASQPLYLMAGLVTIDTSGNVLISGDLLVEGKIESSGLTLKSSPDLTGPGLVTIIGESGEEVAGITASGSAEFKKLETSQIALKADSEATSSATLGGGIVYTTSATAGTAVIPQGITEVVIKNPKIKSDSLIYVTPSTSTQNQVLYLKEQESCENEGIICEPYFTVGFDNPINQEVKFNWWLVDLFSASNQ